MVVGVVENFKVQDRVQQPRLVEVFKVFPQDRVQQLLPQWTALQVLRTSVLAHSS